jgi:hypothetical protein
MSDGRAANSVCSPPPQPVEDGRERPDGGEGLGVGVVRKTLPVHAATPLPNPPSQGGREHTEFAASVLTDLTQTLFG